MARKPRSNDTGKVPSGRSKTARTSKSVKKLNRKGQSPKTVKDPSTVNNKPRQGEPVPQTDDSTMEH